MDISVSYPKGVDKQRAKAKIRQQLPLILAQYGSQVPPDLVFTTEGDAWSFSCTVRRFPMRFRISGNITFTRSAVAVDLEGIPAFTESRAKRSIVQAMEEALGDA